MSFSQPTLLDLPRIAFAVVLAAALAFGVWLEVSETGDRPTPELTTPAQTAQD